MTRYQRRCRAYDKRRTRDERVSKEQYLDRKFRIRPRERKLHHAII